MDMITKEKVKREIDRLSDRDLEKVYLYLTSLNKSRKSQLKIRSFKLGGKLDTSDLRTLF